MKNLIFDLDGTLGDTLPICVQAFQNSLQPFINRTLSEVEITKHFGISEDGIIKSLLPDNSNKALNTYYSCYSALLEKHCTPFSGVSYLLNTLSKQKRFISMVTGKNIVTAKITLKHFDLLDYFTDIYPGSPTGDVKDTNLTNLISKYDLCKSETVYIGDAVSDITAARNCGISIIAAAWASTADIPALKAANPDYLFINFNEFSDFILNTN